METFSSLFSQKESMQNNVIFLTLIGLAVTDREGL